jgi:hypothetical protein
MTLPPSLTLKSKDAWILAGICLLSAGFYLAGSAIIHHPGFPLDDAWIHQTYARSLALRQEWAFLPGHASGGSTAPLWSILLAAGYLLRLPPLAWTYLLGAVSLWGLAVTGEWGMRRWQPGYHPKFPWVGTLVALEWHLTWSAGSGMETLLFTLSATCLLMLLLSGDRRFFLHGVLIGISIWLRPDGITLLGPVVAVLLLEPSTWKIRLRNLAGSLLGGLGLVGLYLLFNLLTSGVPFPGTLYAKQAEYAELLGTPLAARIINQTLPLLAGVGILMFPGALYSLVAAVRKRQWAVLAAIAWSAGFLFMYAWKLPVTYQYGRYILPVMPMLLILGVGGSVSFNFHEHPRLQWFLSTTWRWATTAVLVIFWIIGGSNYARDVALIETEMVATAKWVADQIPANDLLAVHDIGAMGYFGAHELIDLAGLISPEVIPFIRDESRLAEYLDQRGVDYLVVFPDWYEHLDDGLIPVFSTEAPFAPAMGGENMTVFRW